MNRFKHIFLTYLFIGSCFISFAQDSAYYSTAFNTSGTNLKTELNQLIKNHREYPYTSSSTDVWDVLKVLDKDPNNSSNVLLIYSNRSVNAAQEYNSGSGWSREHVWAKSRGNFGTDEGAGTDVHHLRACDVSVNSTRNNRNFDDCINCIDVIDNGFNTGSKRDANLWTFQPPNNVKGDVARMIFYMTVRYEGQGLEPDLELSNTLLSNTDQAPIHSVKETLLEWHNSDPVSPEEKTRNELIYKDYQKNRNPFIDYPELAEYLYGDSTSYVWKPDVKLSTNEKHKSNFKVFPNPTLDSVTIQGNYKQMTIFNSSGQVLDIEPSNRIDLSEYPNGLYYFQLISKKGKVSIVKVNKGL